MENFDSSGTEAQEAIIVKADEVDEAGADISTLLPSAESEADFSERVETRRAHDAQSPGSSKTLANEAPTSPVRPSSRPILRREGSAPAPPQKPPPPAPIPDADNTPGAVDSVSLAQLKQLVAGLPKPEVTAYAYDYSESRTFPEELQEWFSYSEDQTHLILSAKTSFDQTWEQAHSERPESSDQAVKWTDASEEDRTWFVQCAIRALDGSVPASRLRSLECLSYIALGVWANTAGRSFVSSDCGALFGRKPTWLDAQDSKSCLQQGWMFAGARLLVENSIVKELLNVLQNNLSLEQSLDFGDDVPEDELATGMLGLECTLTILYVLVEVARSQPDSLYAQRMRDEISKNDVQALTVLAQLIARLRWETASEPSAMPRLKLFLLFWKMSLFLFGDFEAINESKEMLSQGSSKNIQNQDQPLMTASPLDYHIFRQEITSKYPAYNPPPPLIPIEPENNSILPPLPNHASRRESQDSLHNVLSKNPGVDGSILNQAVHIATPAPSPPPSPAGPGGKGGKKQNYQTNQNFPFLHPSFDDAGGRKTKSKIQQELQAPAISVNRRWDDSDVPASILEAGQLFSSRMRMTRSIRQLWEVRENFIKAERGWSEADGEASESSEDTDFELESEVHSRSLPKNLHPDTAQEPRPDTESQVEPVDSDTTRTEHARAHQQLNAVDVFYRGILPDLQSFTLVLFREIFHNVQSLILKNGPNGVPNGNTEDGPGEGPGKRKTNPNSSASLSGMANGQPAEGDEAATLSVETLNEIRSREITTKAVSGILLTLLKWFKFSHIMKYEYLTQLLLDANFMPLVLKYFAHQDVDKAVQQRNDREDLDFFSFCQQHSRKPPSSEVHDPTDSSTSSSEDDAAPPPISRHRRASNYQSAPPSPPPPAARPEVDELGFPTSGDPPRTPLTNYAPRFFLININLLRILQKITKRKAHRALLLVQYKSSTSLRKALKIPQKELRLYTLKLFKSQVPYCGRKWRQTNMRVITAIYLHCRPTLREEWLCGGDMDGVVEEALPLEQAGRSLVHWWHLRHFRDVMEGNDIYKSRRARVRQDRNDTDSGNEEEEEEGQGIVGKTRERLARRERGVDDDDGGREEYDFFARELEKMGWGFSATGLGGNGLDDEEGYADGSSATGERNEFEGGPLHMEGWA